MTGATVVVVVAPASVVVVSWSSSGSGKVPFEERRAHDVRFEHRPERQLAGGTDCGEGPLAVLDARQLNHDTAITLDGDLRLLDLAEVLDAAPHDVDRFVEDLGSVPSGAVRVTENPPCRSRPSLGSSPPASTTASDPHAMARVSSSVTTRRRRFTPRPLRASPR